MIQSNRIFNSLFFAVVTVGLPVIGTNAYAQQEKIDQLLQLAEQGDAEAQDEVGFVYQKGQGVPHDYSEAVKWYRLAVEQGNAFAQYGLGSMYALGHGVPQDYVEAHKWYNLAASRLTGDMRNSASEQRDLVAQKMTPAQIAEAQRLAREWAKVHEGN